MYRECGFHWKARPKADLTKSNRIAFWIIV
jgi:hypothetical protein